MELEQDIYFKNRKIAGQKLADRLLKYTNGKVVILALPRGGVIIANEIAKAIKAPLDLIITRKIGHPLDPEYAIGAITEEGHLLGNISELAAVNQDWLKGEIENQKHEAKRRRKKYLKNMTRPDLENKVIIIVDDGIATGYTMEAAIYQAKTYKPQKIIIAVPVMPPDFAQKIKPEVDELVAATIPMYFLGAISAYYEEFPQVSDEEVIELLK